MVCRTSPQHAEERTYAPNDEGPGFLALEGMQCQKTQSTSHTPSTVRWPPRNGKIHIKAPHIHYPQYVPPRGMEKIHLYADWPGYLPACPCVIPRQPHRRSIRRIYRRRRVAGRGLTEIRPGAAVTSAVNTWPSSAGETPTYRQSGERIRPLRQSVCWISQRPAEVGGPPT